MIWVAAYFVSVVGVNWIFGVPWLMAETPWGPVSAGSVIVGAGFFLRDLAQESVGKRGVLLAMGAALVASYLVAPPRIALASAAGFAVTEWLDFLVYTRLRQHGRRTGVVGSQLVSASVDTLIFLWGIGALSTGGFAVMTASKLGALLFIALVPGNERNGAL